MLEIDQKSSKEISEKVKCLGQDKKVQSTIYKKIIHGFYIFITIFIILFVSIPLIFTLSPFIAEKYWPVIESVDVKIERHGNVVTFVPTVHKERECRIVDIGWHIIRSSEIINSAIPIDVVNIATGYSAEGNSSYVKSIYELGPFQFMIPNYFDYGKTVENLKVSGLLYYDCNLPWYSRAVLGPFHMPTEDTMFGIIPGLEIKDLVRKQKSE